MHHKLIVIFAGLLSSALANTSCQQRIERSPALPASVAAVESIANQQVTVVGRNYCLGCALKKSEGAAAQCSEYGHRHTLEVETARGADGRPISALAGQSLHYLDNDRSASLVSGKEFHNKRVEIKGKLFGAQRTLEVTEFKAL